MVSILQKAIRPTSLMRRQCLLDTEHTVFVGVADTSENPQGVLQVPEIRSAHVTCQYEHLFYRYVLAYC